MSWLQRLLHALVPPSERDEILGDLEEERARRVAGGDPVRSWHLRQSLLLVLAYGLRRVRAGLPPHGVAAALATVVGDVRTAMRTAARNPAFAAVTVATLAVGLGATTALFTLIHGVLLRPLPFLEPERLVRLGEHTDEAAPDAIWSTSPANFLDLDAQTSAFESLAAYRFHGFSLSGRGPAVRLAGLQVTHDFLQTLGALPVAGRALDAVDDEVGAEPVVAVSSELWAELFGTDAELAGQELVLDGISRRVVGVFAGLRELPGKPAVLVPFAWGSEQRAQRRARSIEALGRLAPGATLEAGLAELRGLFGTLARAYPDVDGGRSIGARPLRDWLVGSTVPRRLLLFSGAALLVLCVACANAVNLGLARARSRWHELGVRAALGAGRGRLLRLLVAESLLLALAGGLLGTCLASAVVRVLVTRLGSWLPRAEAIRVDGGVGLFVLGMSVATGLVVGIVPAAGLRSERLRGSLGEGRVADAVGEARVRRGLVVLEIAVALVLLAGAGLLTRSVWRLARVDLGVDLGNVVAFTLSLPDTAAAQPESFLSFYDSVLESIAAGPGVSAVGGQNRELLRGGGNAYVDLLDPPMGPPFEPYDGLVETREVTPGLFRALGVRLIAGRGLEDDARHEDPPGAVVNRAFVHEVLRDGTALGGTFRMRNSDREFRVVGVVDDVRDFGPDSAAAPTAYFPFGAGPWQPWPRLVVAVRSDRPVAAVAAIRRRLAELDPTVPMENVELLADLAATAIGGSRRGATLLFSIFSVLALSLGMSGVYAVMAYSVSRQTRALGIRKALGATGGDIRRQVLREGMGPAVMGVALGLLGAAAVSRVLSGLLFEVGPLDPPTLALSAAVIVVACLGACLRPARRAAVADVMVALRAE